MKKDLRLISLWESIRSIITSKCGQKLELRYTRILSLTLAICKCKTSSSEADRPWSCSSLTLATARSQILSNCKRYGSIITPIIWIMDRLTIQMRQLERFLVLLLSKTLTPVIFPDWRTRSTFRSPTTAIQAYLWTEAKWTMATSWCSRWTAAITTSYRQGHRWLRVAVWTMAERKKDQIQQLIQALLS